MTHRYQTLFARTLADKRLGYIPFVVVGDPNTEQSLRIIETLIDNGADALELGFAFSDPVADGAEIQQANIRALNANITVADSFALINTVRERYPELPIGLLIYANLVYAQGIDAFYQQASVVGIDSVLIGDCPVRERETFQPHAQKHGVQTVFIAPPDADTETLTSIAEHSEGYVYLLSRKGITGTNVEATDSNADVIDKLREHHCAPIAQGFGISTPEHVRIAKSAGVDAVITGSAVVKIINRHHAGEYDFETMLNKLATYVREIVAAT